MLHRLGWKKEQFKKRKQTCEKETWLFVDHFKKNFKFFLEATEWPKHKVDICGAHCPYKDSNFFHKDLIYWLSSVYYIRDFLFLCVFDYAVHLIMGFKLRNTQRLAIMKLLKVDSLLQYNTFSQVKTGEGKSIIVTGLAIGYAIMNKTNGRSVDGYHQ